MTADLAFMLSYAGGVALGFGLFVLATWLWDRRRARRDRKAWDAYLAERDRQREQFLALHPYVRNRDE